MQAATQQVSSITISVSTAFPASVWVSCYFFPTGGQDYRQYLVCLHIEGWPGWVGLVACLHTKMVYHQNW